MIIRGMNNFFGRYSRWIFGIFTLVIIISFMGIMTPGQYSGCFMGSRNRVGSIFGEEVTYDDLRDVSISTQLFYQSMYGYMPREINMQEAFMLLAQVRAAEQRGIAISDQEIADYIKSIPSFQKEGKFDRELFNTFVKNITENGYTESDFIAGIRNQFMLNRLAVEIQNSIIVTDNEVENFYRVLNEKIVLKAAEFKGEDFKNNTPRDQKEMMDFFEANRDKYMIEAQAKALVATFDFNNEELVKQVNALMTPEALKAYYDENKATFTVTDKDGSKLTPFNEALEKVKINFRSAKTRELALAKAQLFARDVYEKASENPADSLKIFNQMTKENGVKVIACKNFKSSDSKIGGIESPALIQEIFNNSFEIPITNAIVGDNGIYVAYAFDYAAPRRAEFAEMQNEIVADYVDDLTKRAAKNAAEKLYGELKVMAKDDLAKQMAQQKEFKTDLTLDINSVGEDMNKAYFYSVAKKLAVNDISEVVPTQDGAILVYVVKREMPAIGEDFAKEKDNLTAQYKELKVRAAMNEFFGYLEKQCMMVMQN